MIRVEVPAQAGSCGRRRLVLVVLVLFRAARALDGSPGDGCPLREGERVV